MFGVWCLRSDISMMVMCYAKDIWSIDKRTSELSNVPLHMKQDPTSIDKRTSELSNVPFNIFDTNWDSYAIDI